MNLNNLTQVIREPTRYTDDTATLIDIVLTPCPDVIQTVDVLPPVCSDHCCPLITLKNKTNHNFKFQRTIYNYNNLNVEKYQRSLSEVNWNTIIFTNDLEDAAESFSDKILEIAKKCMPSKVIKVRDCDTVWMTESIRSLIKKKHKAHNNAKKSNSAWRWEIFRKIRNKLTDMIRKRKNEFDFEMDDRINEQSNFGSNDWWKLVKRFAAKKGVGDSEIPPLQHEGKTIYSPKEKAHILNDFFISQSEIDGINDNVPLMHVNETEAPPLSITATSVFNIIKNLNQKKSSGPDGVHNKMLTKANNIIARPLSVLFNRSINEGVFPKIWKCAFITPIFKKGDKHLCTNYRPVSLLSCIGKVMERCVHTHVFEYIKMNNLLSVCQSGFVPKDSTTFQLLVIYDDFCKALDKQQTTQAIFLIFLKRLTVFGI